MNHLYKVMVVLSLFCAGVLRAQQPVPSALNYQGVLRDSAGQGITRALTLNFLIYNTPTGDQPLWISQRRVAVEKGYFDVVLSENNGSVPADAVYNHLRGVALVDAFAPQEGEEEVQRWIEVQVLINANAYPLGPRQMVTSTPYALSAGNIRRAEGGFQVHDNLKVAGTLKLAKAEATDTGFEGKIVLAKDLTSEGTIETLGTLSVSEKAHFHQRRKDAEGQLVKSGPHVLAAGSATSQLTTVKTDGTAYLQTFVPETFAGTNVSFHVMNAANPAVIASDEWRINPLKREDEAQMILYEAPCDGFLSITVELVSTDATKGVVAELQFGKETAQLDNGRKLELRHTNKPRSYTETVTLPISKGTACRLKLTTAGGTAQVTRAAFVGLNRSTTLPAGGN